MCLLEMYGFDGLHLKCRFGLTDFAFSTSFEASLIALEMFIAAAAHAFVFSHMFYRDRAQGDPKHGTCAAIKDTLTIFGDAHTTH
jgi:hypothetical protein